MLHCPPLPAPTPPPICTPWEDAVRRWELFVRTTAHASDPKAWRAHLDAVTPPPADVPPPSLAPRSDMHGGVLTGSARDVLTRAAMLRARGVVRVLIGCAGGDNAGGWAWVDARSWPPAGPSCGEPRALLWQQPRHPAAASTGPVVAVVGGGYCGAALVSALLQKGPRPLRIAWIEPAATPGPGLAYSGQDPLHLLNVSAGCMRLPGAPAQPFASFVRRRDPSADGDTLAPRAWFGAWIVAELAQAMTAACGVRVDHYRSPAVQVQATGRGGRVLLADGTTLEADQVVLATGHAMPRVPAALADHEGSPWLLHRKNPLEALEELDRTERVLVVGTGLTALDLVRGLRHRGHQGRVLALSRRGQWPAPHLADRSADLTLPELPPVPLGDVDAATAWAGCAFAAQREAGRPWQRVVDAIRLQVPALWQSWDLDARRSFLHGRRSAWERLRHRAPAPHLDDLDAWSCEGWLTTLGAHVEHVVDGGDSVRVDVRCSDGSLRQLQVDRIVLCTGADGAAGADGCPLWIGLLREGCLVPEPLGLGVMVDADGRAQTAEGKVLPWLRVMGAATRGDVFERTAVPDLCVHGERVAHGLVHDLAAAR